MVCLYGRWMLRCVGAKSKRTPFSFCSIDVGMGFSNRRCRKSNFALSQSEQPVSCSAIIWLSSYQNHCIIRTFSSNNCNQSVSESCFRSFTVDNPPKRDLNFESSDVHPILRSSSLQHWFKNWNELRRHKLTASTFAGAIGFWPRRRTQLWLEKIGAIEPFPGNLATRWSNIKEEEALERYKLITGNSVLFPEFQVYDVKDLEDDWLAASPDGVVNEFVFGLSSRGVLEIKCPFFNGDKEKASPWSRIPLYCIPQAQGLMELMDRDWMDFYVWTLKGSSLFRLFRDLEYWKVLKIALSDFWWKHVQPAREICSKYCVTDPLTELRSLRPSPRHDLCSSIVCQSKRIVDSSKLLVREIDASEEYLKLIAGEAYRLWAAELYSKRMDNMS